MPLNWRAQALGLIGFVALYPIFFWYHVGIAYGVIPVNVYRLLLGFYGVTCVIIVVCYFMLIMGSTLSTRTPIFPSWIHLAFFAYGSWCLLLITYNLAFGYERHLAAGSWKLISDSTL